MSDGRAFWTTGARAALVAERPAHLASRPLDLAILRTVLYASLFDYPLTAGQVARSLLEARANEREILRAFRGSARLPAALDYQDGFFFPRGRADLIHVRRLRESGTRLLLRRNRRALKLICLVPGTRLVALSGSAAHLNVDGDGDIDLFIVTRRARAWSVSLTIVLLTKLLGCRRTFCANYVMTDETLEVEQPDVFSANQILHLQPIVDDGVYARFVAANPFVRHFYPGFEGSRRPLEAFAPGAGARAIKRIIEMFLALGPGRLYEAACRAAYSRYLRGRARRWPSPEQVRLEPGRLKLHGHSHRREVLARFERTVAAALEQAERAGCGSDRRASSA